MGMRVYDVTAKGEPSELIGVKFPGFDMSWDVQEQQVQTITTLFRDPDSAKSTRYRFQLVMRLGGDFVLLQLAEKTSGLKFKITFDQLLDGVPVDILDINWADCVVDRMSIAGDHVTIDIVTCTKPTMVPVKRPVAA